MLTGSSWKTLPEMRTYRRGHPSCSIMNNKLVVLGGQGRKSVEFFDFEQNSWSVGARLPTYFELGYSMVEADKLYALYTDGSVVRMAEDKNTWDKVAKNDHWGYGNYRPFDQAVRVTKKMVGC